MLSGKILQGRLGAHFFIAGKLEDEFEFQIPLIHALQDRLHPEALVICDFGPGTGISVSVGLSKMNIAVIILQPAADWERNLTAMLDMTGKINIPAGLILNKVNDDMLYVSEVKAFCSEHSIPLLGILPSDEGLDLKADCHEADGSGALDRSLMEIWEGFPGVHAEPGHIKKETFI